MLAAFPMSLQFTSLQIPAEILSIHEVSTRPPNLQLAPSLTDFEPASGTICILGGANGRREKFDMAGREQAGPNPFRSDGNCGLHFTRDSPHGQNAGGVLGRHYHDHRDAVDFGSGSYSLGTALSGNRTRVRDGSVAAGLPASQCVRVHCRRVCSWADLRVASAAQSRL